MGEPTHRQASGSRGARPGAWPRHAFRRTSPEDFERGGDREVASGCPRRWDCACRVVVAPLQRRRRILVALVLVAACAPRAWGDPALGRVHRERIGGPLHPGRASHDCRSALPCMPDRRMGHPRIPLARIPALGGRGVPGGVPFRWATRGVAHTCRAHAGRGHHRAFNHARPRNR